MLTRRDGFWPWFRLLLSALVVVGTGFLAVASLLRPTPSVALIFGITLWLVLAGAVLPTVDDFRFGRALKTERYITAELRAAFAFLVETGKFDPLKLRLHFFEVRRVWNWNGPPVTGWRWRWRGRPVVRALVRGGFFSIKSDEALSNVAWQEGVGVVGTVWQARNVSGLAANVSIANMPTLDAWSALPAEHRFNMPWELARRMRRIEAVYAVAVLAEENQGEVVAVLSVDTIADDLPKFEAPAVKAFLRRTGRGAWQSRFLRRN